MNLIFFILLQAVPYLPSDDPGHCGIGVVETGDWDPFFKSGACPKHDSDMYGKKTGQLEKSALEVTADFAVNVLETAGLGAFAVGAAPFYLAFGGIGGLAIMAARTLAKKDEEND